MIKSKCLYLFSFFVVFSTTCLFPGLLPDNVVMVSPNKYCKIKDLKTWDYLTATDKPLGLCKSPFSAVLGIQIHKNLCKTATLIVLQSSDGIISSLFVGEYQRFFVLQANLSRRKGSWVDAKNLRKGLVLRGYGKKNLVVKDIEHINLQTGTDLYEISLNNPNTFYLVDSNGNRILTHNIFGVDDLMILGTGFLIGAVIGGTIGGSYAAYKAYSKGVLSTKTVAEGVLVGALVGGAATAITYYGIYLGYLHFAGAIKALKAAGANAEQAREAFAFFSANKEVIYFIGTTSVGTEISAGVIAAGTIENYVEETAKREYEDTDFSKVNLKVGEITTIKIQGKTSKEYKVFRMIREK